MRVLIDATSLLVRSAGVKNLNWHWLESLHNIAPPGSIHAFPMLGGARGELNHEGSIAGTAATYARLGTLYAINHGGRFLLDRMCRPFDVFHASNLVHTVPRRVAVTTILHDLTAWRMPEFHTAATIEADRRFAFDVLPHARRVWAVSENTRDDAQHILRLDPEHIEVIYPGVDERYFAARPAQRTRPYALAVGAIEPRKNLDAVLEAWNQLPGELRRTYDLVVAGPAGWKSDATLARLRSTDGVDYLGYVPEADLPGLTAGAAVFLYPSLYEGFGFPAAQAMAAGVPVVTSNTSSLPEVVGEGGILVDPRSTAEIASAIERLLADADLRASLGAAGRARAQAVFDWERCARATWSFFERALGE